MAMTHPDSEAWRARVSQRAGALADGFARRAALARAPAPPEARGPALRLFLAEAASFVDAARVRMDPPAIALAAERRVVILLPGFGTNARRMRFMAQQLERAGHKVKRWGLGYNLGPTPENFAALSDRIEAVHARYGQRVYLVGWSLGGLFARELAKVHPDKVAKVVTMGSPFSRTPYANNVWRAYQLVTGHSVAEPPLPIALAVKPPVETVALWSPRDGMIAPRSARGLPGERDRAVALRCTHLGFCHDPAAIRAVLAELG